MKIFDENTYCPKCHSPEILSRWMDKDLPYWKLPPDDKEKLEHIHRRCQRCGYWWNEAPIDSKKGYMND